MFSIFRFKLAKEATEKNFEASGFNFVFLFLVL